ncbi:nickel transporter permease NikB [Clostridium carboxidivorans P7]|uniref:Nickel import system permease protein NikB n=1 Tax=Clostridium carboxidivorans P7 TaxID=536227 RepID=C6PRF9_9CLOT|nr:nickel ABC transporter permease [Clostridium carboxidivorans]AKN31506.1 nickel transporter permease NikB [Clostridium carboxidivorans P7]EET88140.1 binding-protein-dependent transport systems inner membrane component [Clostridium carboxidivorans P7]EFG87096.1 putative nickel ABC transporter, permease subunit NikB [Clostridium carboxidivorans P7]
MRKYIIKRLIHLIPVLFGITFLTFAITYFSPGDPAVLMLSATGVSPSPELVQKVREELGLNNPFLVQYFHWLMSVFKGNFGNSYKYSKPVLDLILEALPATFKLAGTSLIAMMLIALPLGIMSALHRNKVLDYIIRVVSFFGISMPGFWVGLLLMYIFSIKLKILPVMGDTGWKSIILPMVTLTIAMASKYTRQLRAAVLEEISQDYVIGARARGIKERAILFGHVMQSSLLSIVTLLGLSLGSLLGGTAIVETIFSWPGVGKLAVEAIFSRDYPLIQGYVVWMTVIYVLINLIVDISYYFLDPRIRLEKRA